MASELGAPDWERPCCDHCNNAEGDPGGHDPGDPVAHDEPCPQCADAAARPAMAEPPRVARTRAAMEARFAEFCRVRDAGTDRAAAGAQVGIAADTTSRYELAWKRSRGVPLGEPGIEWREH